jgi:hypothetical protein
MKKWTVTLIAGSALILLTNAVVLSGAAYNRSGDAESQMRLSQRELQHYRLYEHKDNSHNSMIMTLIRDTPPENGESPYG